MNSNLKPTKAQLIEMLAKHRMRQYPELYGYGEHRDDAVFFVVNHLGPRRSQLLLSAKCLNLISEDAE